MEQSEFIENISKLIAEKQAWFDSAVLPDTLNNYRLFHTCVANIFSALEKKSLIQPDPYKKDNKISDITMPEDSDFNDNERPKVLGGRLSFYDSVLDFICNYVKFTTEGLSLAKIKKLISFNNAFHWLNLTANSASSNTRALAHSINIVKQGGDPVTNSLVYDCISKTKAALNQIDSSLKELSDFQRETYKFQVRRSVMEAPRYSSENPSDGKAAYELVRKLYKDGMGNIPFYTDLIQELVDEEFAADKDKRREAVLKRLQIPKKTVEKEVQQVDTKAMAMDAVLMLGAFPQTLDIIAQKIKDNHDAMLADRHTLFDKFKALLRRAFNLDEPETSYTISITDPKTGKQSQEKIEYSKFLASLAQRARYYNAAATDGSSVYNKIFAMPENEIGDMATQHLNECQRLFVRLNALDAYFKNAAGPQIRSKIKGLQMELTVLKNSIAKLNQRRVEYFAYVEEQEQIKKLGIEDEK